MKLQINIYLILFLVPIFAFGQLSDSKVNPNLDLVYKNQQEIAKSMEIYATDIDLGFNTYLDKYNNVEYSSLYVLCNIYKSKVYALILLNDNKILGLIAENMCSYNFIEFFLNEYFKNLNKNNNSKFINLIDLKVAYLIDIIRKAKNDTLTIDTESLEYQENKVLYEFFNENFNISSNKLLGFKKLNFFKTSLFNHVDENLLKPTNDYKKIVIKIAPEDKDYNILINNNRLGTYQGNIKKNGIIIPANKECELKIIFDNKIVFFTYFNKKDDNDFKSRTRSTYLSDNETSKSKKEVNWFKITELDDLILVNLDFLKK